MVISYGKHMIAHWSKLQTTIAVASGEAELNAAVKGASEAIGIYELLQEWDLVKGLNFYMLTDSSAAKGTLTRRGSGKIKHLTTKQLWVQEAIRNYGIEVMKIPREINSADLLTHQCQRWDFEGHIKRLNIFRV